MVWPIFLAVEVKTYGSIGVITALAALVAIGVVTVAGRRGDQGHDRRVMKEGVAVSSVVDLLRLIPFGTFGITVVGVVYRASLAYMQNPWTSTYYHHAKKGGIAYVMSMEIAGDLAYVSLWLTLLALVSFGSATLMFNVAFVIAAAAAWGCLLITKQRHA